MPEIRPFSGVRIIDMTYRYGCYATKLFADLGAQVIRVEPPGGLPDRQVDGTASNRPNHAFSFLNTSKLSVTIDLDSAAGQGQFEDLARDSRMIFVERGGPMFERLGDLRLCSPSAVITAVSPYGLGGPMTDAPASDLTLQAAGGIAWLSGRPGEPPLRLPLGQAAMIASNYAATVAAAALMHVEAVGCGHLIDVSVQECIAHTLQNAIQVWDLERRISMRGGEGTRDATEDLFACADGYVFLAAPITLGVSWRELVRWMAECGHPSAEILQEERWSDRPWRTTREAKRLFREAFEAFLTGFTKRELTEQAIARKIVLGPVSRISELFGDEQLVHRRFFVAIKDGESGKPIAFPGAPYKLSADAWKVRPAPALGEDNRLLDDLRRH